MRTALALTMGLALVLGSSGTASGAPGLVPEPNDPEVVEAVAAAVVPSIKSVTARADVPGGIPDAAGITVTILSGTTQLASQPYTDLKGAHPRVDLPAEEGRIRTVDLTIKVSNGRHTVTIPWTAQVRPLYRIVVSDLRLKRTATPRCDPDGSMQVVARWVGPDGTPHEASGTSPDRVYHFPEFVTTLTDVDVTGAFSMDWYEQDPGEPVPPQNFVTAPLAFAASPTLVGHGQLKEGGGDCAGRLSYSYTWTLRTF